MSALYARSLTIASLTNCVPLLTTVPWLLFPSPCLNRKPFARPSIAEGPRLYQCHLARDTSSPAPHTIMLQLPDTRLPRQSRRPGHSSHPPLPTWRPSSRLRAAWRPPQKRTHQWTRIPHAATLSSLASDTSAADKQ
jgi:hypothetical protein